MSCLSELLVTYPHCLRVNKYTHTPLPLFSKHHMGLFRCTIELPAASGDLKHLSKNATAS